jgi:spore maturation protein A
MLNVIWLILISVGILFAAGQDIYDLSSDRFHNGHELKINLQTDTPTEPSLKSNQPYPCTVAVDPGDYRKWAEWPEPKKVFPFKQKGELYLLDNKKGRLHIKIDEQTPPLWQEISGIQKNQGFLLAQVHWPVGGPASGPAFLRFDPIRFSKLQAVTNDGLIHYAKVAVELALGLIGVMALWLGLMKIAEEAGLIARLARALKGITRRLFPDVPPDHPAMGAMIMNMSANMLGLGNAATPLGLKAMEELNKLNPKPGVATDAMCTFLVINTSNVQLIPATVIAIRAAAGSTNPTEILGPVILATTVNTLVGVVVVKFMAKWPIFKKQREREGK